MRRLAVALMLFAACASAGTRRRAVSPARDHEWARGAVFYEIFVRSYDDSNGDGNGDFPGLTSKLDYISSLGVDAIWLMPVFQAASYHGYDATDYETIERDFGTNADFRNFLGEAHKRGIRVIVDYVMNHTSNQHPWFLDSASSATSAHRDWYIWNATNPGWTQPWGPGATWYPLNGAWYYGVFWSGMPDLNYRSPAVKAEMFRIAEGWLRQGVDGFRLDATRYLIEDGPGAGQYDTPETHQLLKDFAADVEQTKPDAILVAENTVETPLLATYYADVPMNFNFPLASAIVDGVSRGNAANIVSTIREIINDYPAGSIDAPFLTNHDQIRIATQLSNDGAKLRDAAAILLTLPGAPFIYYGEELGMQNGPGGADEQKRTPMPWSASGGFTTGTPWFAYAPGLTSQNVASETNDASSLLAYYRSWIAARHRSSALLKGDIALIDAPPQVLAFTRTSADDRVVVAHNLGNTSAQIKIDVADAVQVDPGVTAANGQVMLPAHTSGVWRIHS